MADKVVNEEDLHKDIEADASKPGYKRRRGGAASQPASKRRTPSPSSGATGATDEQEKIVVPKKALEFLKQLSNIVGGADGWKNQGEEVKMEFIPEPKLPFGYMLTTKGKDDIEYDDDIDSLIDELEHDLNDHSVDKLDSELILHIMYPSGYSDDEVVPGSAFEEGGDFYDIKQFWVFHSEETKKKKEAVKKTKKRPQSSKRPQLAPKRRESSPPPATQPDAEDSYWEEHKAKNPPKAAVDLLERLSDTVNAFKGWTKDEVQLSVTMDKLRDESTMCGYILFVNEKAESFCHNDDIDEVLEHMDKALEDNEFPETDKVTISLYITYPDDDTLPTDQQKQCQHYYIQEDWTYNEEAKEKEEKEEAENKLYDPEDDVERPKDMPSHSLLCWISHGRPMHFLIPDKVINKAARSDLFAVRGYLCTKYSTRNSPDEKEKFAAMHRIGSRIESCFGEGGDDDWAKWRCPAGNNYAPRTFVSRLYVTGYASGAFGA